MFLIDFIIYICNFLYIDKMVVLGDNLFILVNVFVVKEEN